MMIGVFALLGAVTGAVTAALLRALDTETSLYVVPGLVFASPSPLPCGSAGVCRRCARLPMSLP
jgi:hypothetical protein